MTVGTWGQILGQHMYQEEEPAIEPRPEVRQEIEDTIAWRQDIERRLRLVETRLRALDADREDIPESD